MKHTTPSLLILLLGFPGALVGFDYASLEADVQKRLMENEAVVLPQRPDETTTIDKRFVTVAQLLEGTQREIWEVIHDKEDAEKFVDGVVESRVIESSETEILVEQRTKVGGPKGAYYYKLRHKLQPLSRSDFKYVEGEMRDVEGTWWIMEGPAECRCLVIYSLHIDPGVFAPQIVVKRGMKKSMPGTLQSMQKEVLRRRKGTSNEND